MRDNAKGGALTEVTFYILLSLYTPKHGYAVMQFVEEKTGGRLSLGAGNLRNPWLFLLLMFALFAVTKQSIIFGIFALVSVIPGSIYQIQIMKIRKEAKTQEW